MRRSWGDELRSAGVGWVAEGFMARRKGALKFVEGWLRNC